MPVTETHSNRRPPAPQNGSSTTGNPMPSPLAASGLFAAASPLHGHESAVFRGCALHSYDSLARTPQNSRSRLGFQSPTHAVPLRRSGTFPDREPVRRLRNFFTRPGRASNSVAIQLPAPRFRPFWHARSSATALEHSRRGLRRACLRHYQLSAGGFGVAGIKLPDSIARRRQFAAYSRTQEALAPIPET